MSLRLNPNLESIAPSAIRAMHERKRPSSLDLGIGEPSLEPDIGPFVEATEWIRAHGCHYAPNAGLPELRDRIAAIYGGRFCGKAENVCVTNGSQEGIYLAVKALLEPGCDEVLLTDPTYPAYRRCCELEGVRYQTVSLSSANGFALHAKTLLESLTPATRLIIIGSPSNPTGAVFSAEEMRMLANGLANRSGPPVFVLVDEVYRELVFTGEPYVSLLDLYPYAMAVQSLSKSCALTGLRLGFLFAPKDVLEAVIRTHALLMMSISIFAQQLALAIVREPGRLRVQHRWYAEQRRLLLNTLQELGLNFIEPQGAFYCMVKLPRRFATSREAADALLEQQDVVTVPGSVFGSATEGFLRLTWAAQSDVVTQGLARIAAFFAG